MAGRPGLRILAISTRQLFANINELEALSLVLKTEGLPAIATLRCARNWRQKIRPELVVNQSVAYNLPIIVNVKGPTQLPTRTRRNQRIQVGHIPSLVKEGTLAVLDAYAR